MTYELGTTAEIILLIDEITNGECGSGRPLVAQSLLQTVHSLLGGGGESLPADGAGGVPAHKLDDSVSDAQLSVG